MDDEPINPEYDLVRWNSEQRARDFLCSSKNALNLTTGSPGWDPFKPGLDAAHTTINRGNIIGHYHSTRGTFSDASYPDYFASLGIKGDGGTPLSRENFVPGTGATHLYAAIVQQVLENDDILVVPVPTYGFFLDEDNLRGRRVIPLKLRPEDNYCLTPEVLDKGLADINARLALENPPASVTALLHINPHNPTGAVNTKESVEALAEIIKKHDVGFVIDDMAYMGMEYSRGDNPSTQDVAYPMAAVDGMFDRTVTITSLSKAFSMVDLRAGLAMGPAWAIDHIADYVQRTSEFVNSSAQAAMHMTYAPKHKDAREVYLANHAIHLRDAYQAIRLLIEGTDHAQQLLEAQGGQETFLKKISNYHQMIGESEAFDIEGKKAQQKKDFDEEYQKIFNSPDLLEEARPYLREEVVGKWVENMMKTSHEDEKFNTAKFIQGGAEKLLKEGIPGIKVVDSARAGFFMTLDASALKGKYLGAQKIQDATDFTNALSRYCGVYLLPGTHMGYYGDELLLRLSFPNGVDKDMISALTRIKKFTEVLKDRPSPMPNIAQGQSADSWFSR